MIAVFVAVLVTLFTTIMPASTVLFIAMAPEWMVMATAAEREEQDEHQSNDSTGNSFFHNHPFQSMRFLYDILFFEYVKNLIFMRVLALWMGSGIRALSIVR